MRAAHAAQVMPSRPRSIRRHVARDGAAAGCGGERMDASMTWTIYPYGVSVKGRRSEERRCSEPDLAGQDVLVHDPVADEAVNRMREGRRPVVFEEKVPHPREAVAAQRRAEEPPRIACSDRCKQAAEHERRADEVQPARN